MPPNPTSRHARFRRRGIAGLLWFAGLLAALQAYWWVMANYGIPDFFDPPYGMKRALLAKRVAEYPGHPLWLVMGSSRVVFGFRPDIIEDRLREKDAPMIYNFGLSGVGLFREYIYFKRLLADGFQPRRVGIEIFAADLSHELFPTSEAPALIVRPRENEIADYLRYSSTPPDFLAIWKQSRRNPACDYGMLMAHQTRAWLLLPGGGRLEKQVFDKWGWVMMANTTTEQQYRAEFATSRSSYWDPLQHFTITPHANEVLRAFLDLCRDKGIPAFLLKMPESDDFRAMHTERGDAMVAAWLAQIQGEYDVPMIDASTWIERLGFTDGHHLNGVGAAEFTKRFADAMMELKWPGNH